LPRSARRRLEKVIYFAAARSRASKTTRTFWRGVGLVYGISELATAEVYCGVSLSTVRLCVPNMCLISSKDVLYTCTQCETKQLSKESRARARARRNGQRERSHTVNGHTATGHTRTRLRVKHRPRVVLSPRAECVAWNARKRPARTLSPCCAH